MYLHYLLSLDENELLFKVFQAQQENPVRNDWCQTVRDDLDKLNINLNNKEIKRIKREAFKKLVKKKCKEASLKYLIKEKDKVESKMGKLSERGSNVVFKAQMASPLQHLRVSGQEKRPTRNMCQQL